MTGVTERTYCSSKFVLVVKGRHTFQVGFEGPISRSEISDKCDLSVETVTNLATEFLAEGSVIEKVTLLESYHDFTTPLC